MEDGNAKQDAPCERGFGIALGIITQICFLITVGFLFEFLHHGRTQPSRHWFLIDGLLALQFGVVHSLLLHPAVKRQLTRRLKAEWYGLCFCLVTCGGLALVFVYWRGSPGMIWQATGATRIAVEVGFYASWVGLFHSLWLSGLSYQTGLTPWLHWVKREPAPRRQLVMHGTYRWLRHPAYLSFFGLIWCTSRMSWDHALLTGIWTVYIFIGSYLKDERLAFYAGSAYREYQARVPGYPFLPGGVLGRRKTGRSPAPRPFPGVARIPEAEGLPEAA